ncbi:7TMR-DISMED2 domain-containing protein [Desulfolithobacter dissulfuricans]|uniref:7TMR-DISMED2 domain-containing protein n=1 Tax=Desulfolithobacter dissulfuricans TaxID=2795293 RepID=UPI00338D5F0E
MPFGTREVQHRNFLFRISIPPGTHTWYARIETESAMFFPMILGTNNRSGRETMMPSLAWECTKVSCWSWRSLTCSSSFHSLGAAGNGPEISRA